MITSLECSARVWLHQTRSSLPLGPAATDSVHGEVTGSEDVVVMWS